MLAAVPRPPLGSNEGKSAESAHVAISRVGFTPNVARPAGGVKGMPGLDRVPGPPHDAAPTSLCKPLSKGGLARLGQQAVLLQQVGQRVRVAAPEAAFGGDAGDGRRKARNLLALLMP